VRTQAALLLNQVIWVNDQSLDHALQQAEAAQRLFADRLLTLKHSGGKPVPAEPVAVVERKFREACDRVTALDQGAKWIEGQSSIEFDQHSDPAELIDAVVKMVRKLGEPLPSSFDLIKEDVKKVEEEVGQPYRDARKANLELITRVRQFAAERPEEPSSYRLRVASILHVFAGILRLDMEVSKLYRDRLSQQLSHSSAKAQNPLVTVSGQHQYSLEFDGRRIQLGGPDSYLFAIFLPKILLNQADTLASWPAISSHCSQCRPKGSTNSQQRNPDPSQGLDTREKLRITKRLERLRVKLIKALGSPPNGGQWLVTKHGEGVHLNTSVAWHAADDLKKLFHGSGPYDHSVDPRTLEETFVDPKSPGEPRPGRGRRLGRRPDPDN